MTKGKNIVAILVIPSPTTDVSVRVRTFPYVHGIDAALMEGQFLDASMHLYKGFDRRVSFRTPDNRGDRENK